MPVPRARTAAPTAAMRPFLLVLLSLAPAIGCADAPAVEAPVVRVRGIYLEPMYEGAAMLVDHEAIPERMPAMQMAMRVASPALLEGLEEGAPVMMTLDSASLDVVAVEPLPQGTPLDLAPDGLDGSGIVLPE